jgi:ribosome-associated protein
MNSEKLLKELSFKTALSGGPGGQHVNKTETKVILEWNLLTTEVFSEEQLQKIRLRLGKYISKEGILQLNSSKTRSQHKNKGIVIDRLWVLLEEALKPRKQRKATQPSKASKIKRLTKKKQHSEIKKNRKSPLL